MDLANQPAAWGASPLTTGTSGLCKATTVKRTTRGYGMWVAVRTLLAQEPSETVSPACTS